MDRKKAEELLDHMARYGDLPNHALDEIPGLLRLWIAVDWLGLDTERLEEVGEHITQLEPPQ